MRKKGLERYLLISSIASILIVVVSFMSATFYNPVIKQSLQYGEISDLYTIKEALDATFDEKISYVICENEYVANEYVTLNEEDKVVFDRLITMLEDIDDVENVYHNVD